jgi:hypothetical protein
MPDHDEHDHDAVDGCLCGHPRAEHEATEDHDLPAAVGGVQGDRAPRARARVAKAVRVPRPSSVKGERA